MTDTDLRAARRRWQQSRTMEDAVLYLSWALAEREEPAEERST